MASADATIPSTWAAPAGWLTPRRLFSLAALLVLACCGAALWLALQQPWLGLAPQALQPGAEGTQALRSGTGLLPPHQRLLSLAGRDGAALSLSSDDLIEEPDMHPGYAEWGAFYARQDALAAALRSGPVTLSFEGADGAARQQLLTPAPGRPLASLPAVFWFQLMVGAVGALVGAWVLGLRPADWAARCLALTGLGLLAAACPAAVYGTRELALPADLFRLLSTINHLGTISFGIGLVGIFLFHPQRLASTRLFAGLAAVFLAWAVADVAWWLPSPDLAMRLVVVLQMLAAMALGAWQWRRARGQPLERAALRWVLLSFLVGCGAFVVLIICTAMLGWLPPLSQGYAFGFFLLMYLGLALGVRRYRLFDLDRWSLRVLMWVFGLTGIVLVDALLVVAHVNASLSLAASILLCAAVYFPLRQWLWARLSPQAEPDIDALAGRIAALSLAPAVHRPGAWQDLLGGLFAPLRVETPVSAPEGGQAVLLQQGLGLQVPGGHGLPALQFWQRDQGRRLFSPRDARLAERLLRLAGMVVQAREAHEHGARQERQRIAADLHDDLGGKLLSIAQAGDLPRAAGLAREALDDMRLAVQGLMAGPAAAADVWADWRRETVERAGLAGLRTDWQAQEPTPAVALAPRLRMQATRMLREAATNAIRHGQAQRLRVALAVQDGWLAIEVSDDGTGLAAPVDEAAAATGGQGLAGLQRRARALGGHCEIGPAAPRGTRVAIRLPLQAVADNPCP